MLTLLAACDRHDRSATPANAASSATARVGVLPEGADKPNIVLILVDALRADRLGAYGHRGGLTGTMDSLASAGVTFDLCVAPAPWTLPSVGSIFTAYYPGVHKAASYRVVASMEEGHTAQQSILSSDFTTLAEVLQANGYETAGFCANKFIREPYGFAQGFDHFDTSFAGNGVVGSRVNKAALEWLEKRKSDKPFFLYLHYMDVHGPYDAAPRFMDPLMQRVEANPSKRRLRAQELGRLNPYLKKPPPATSDPGRYERLREYHDYWVARYDAGVAEADFYLKQMLDRLTEMDLRQDALIILLADHGEALCEHGLWDHGYSHYQTDLHVPLIMVWNGILPAGTRVRSLAGLIGITPTIMEQLRIPVNDEVQGKSLLDHLSGTLPDQPQVCFAEAIKAGAPAFAVFADKLKLIMKQAPRRRLPDGSISQPTVSCQLFNLADDAGEVSDMSYQDPERVRMLAKSIQEFVRKNQRIAPGVLVQRKPVEAETIKQLRSLGYVGGSEDDAADGEAE